ncbi:MAG: glucose-1-phosphate thymidylyltransferase [Flavobacteriaceae bacterium]|jgi:dTDP-glucose pyrophosphorylase|nr:glucose-1-phosphate thymidylyltransferase [Flavobacteriaceae bacterium]|tara:strand:- start:175 stop:1014 length:840 start_codon:yes stop_codon:yes gene_type:complete
MNSLIIMAGGASSRMKRSLHKTELTEDQKNLAQKAHKSLIPLGKAKKPLLFHLISNSVAAGFTDIYLVTSPDNEAFQTLVGTLKKNNSFAGARVHFSIQYIKKGYEKPMGTADAIEQTLVQYPELLECTFTICNGDNLYSKEVFQKLLQPRERPNALISYARSGLRFADERISKFAVIDIDADGYLNKIIEKPDPETVEMFRDSSGEIGVSMNIFSFFGKQLYPYLKDCKMHPIRNEKELPEAIKMLNQKEPKQIQCFRIKEHILDLTSAEDIASFESL